MFAMTKEKGEAMAVPDVCLTPSPVGPVPIPYPNIALAPTGDPVADKVLINGMPALNKQSKMVPTNGDEPGENGGVVSHVDMGEAEIIMGSTKVMLQGHPAMVQGNPTKHNKGNALGSITVPSQDKVMIMS